jgi:hypothetical protein
VNDTVNGKLAESAAGSASTLGGTVVLRQQQQQLRGVQQLADEDGAACVILARNMNGQQVRDLARSLSQPERNLYARVQLERSDAYHQTALTTLARASDQQKDKSISDLPAEGGAGAGTGRDPGARRSPRLRWRSRLPG